LSSNLKKERIKNEHIKEIMGVQWKPDITDIIEKERLQWYGRVKRMPEERITKLVGMDTTGEEEKRTSKKNMDGTSTSSHDDKKFRTKSMEKQGGMAFGFRKTTTAVIKPER
jgi:hypothetical protein